MGYRDYIMGLYKYNLWDIDKKIIHGYIMGLYIHNHGYIIAQLSTLLGIESSFLVFSGISQGQPAWIFSDPVGIWIIYQPTIPGFLNV